VKISIITPTLNSARFVRQTIESVLSQQGDFELQYIIRDGQSTDDTLSILREYEGRCLVVTEKDGSPQAAINAGMAQATGDVLGWLNADDVYEPGALQFVAEEFSKHPGYAWGYGRCRITNENGQEIRKPITFYKNILGWYYNRNVLLCENFINQPATFFRREYWLMAGGLSLMYKAAFDYDLWLRMAKNGPAFPIREYLARFRRHEGSISENHFTQQFKEEIDIVAMYGNMWHRTLHELNRCKIILVYHMLAINSRQKHS
jgi:glycosyltransferase involved in cell wall biosynthesis